MFFYGSTGSGKSYTMQGSGPEPGLTNHILEAAYLELENKMATNPSFKFTAKVRFTEILNEQASDLLEQGSMSQFSRAHVKIDEWEGPIVQGIRWLPVSNREQLLNFFKGGCRNWTTRENEFGKMREKACQLFQVEFTQN